MGEQAAGVNGQRRTGKFRLGSQGLDTRDSHSNIVALRDVMDMAHPPGQGRAQDCPVGGAFGGRDGYFPAQAGG